MESRVSISILLRLVFWLVMSSQPRLRTRFGWTILRDLMRIVRSEIRLPGSGVLANVSMSSFADPQRQNAAYDLQRALAVRLDYKAKRQGGRNAGILDSRKELVRLRLLLCES